MRSDGKTKHVHGRKIVRATLPRIGTRLANTSVFMNPGTRPWDMYSVCHEVQLVQAGNSGRSRSETDSFPYQLTKFHTRDCLLAII